MRLSFVFLFSLAMAQPLAAKVPLQEVLEIDDALMKIAIADEIRNRCDDIHARIFRAMARLDRLKRLALSKGYTRDEIEDYVTSKAQKRRMEVKAKAYLTDLGVDHDAPGALCRFGKAEIKRDSEIGQILR